MVNWAIANQNSHQRIIYEKADEIFSRTLFSILAVACSCFIEFFRYPPPLGEVSKNGKYKIVEKDMYPVNPIGLYCLLTTDWSPIYFMLYDRNGYVGQSSPFVCYGAWSGAATLFPGEAVNLDKNSFLVLDDEYDGELNISTKDKRWWSWWFGMFY